MTTKKIFLAIAVLLSVTELKSQGIAINSNGATADATSMLDVSSNSKGILIPRLRTTERTSIANVANGLLVFDIDTRSFWYYSSGWKELLNSGAAVAPGGNAGGDLSGTYPTPAVIKIQNLDIAPGVPFDKQVLKWDALNNRWQGQNDSLLLPYNVSFGSATKLFGITNSNTANGATAIYGKSGNTGAGITPGSTVAVWGDNSSGLGVVGTSNTGVGTYGFSFQNHGVSGYTTNNAFAGVYGSHANNGAGVMGEAVSAGIAVYGKANSTAGKAGFFEITNSANADTALKIIHPGQGIGLQVGLTNATSFADAINVSHSGSGNGIYSKSENGAAARFEITNALNSTGNALDVYTAGLKSAAYFQLTNANNTNLLLAGSNYGKGGGLSLGLYNLSNNSDGIDITHNGTGNGIYAHVASGKAALFDNSSTTTTNEVLNVKNIGKGNAAKLVTSNTANDAAALSVSTNGTGYGIELTNTNAASTNAAIYSVSLGASGIFSYAANNSIYGFSTANTGGVGVWGQSSAASNDGIGVKGISYSTVSTSGAVTGINSSTGIGVYGSSAGADGTAVKGIAPGTNGTGVYAESTDGYGIRGITYSASPFKAAVVGSNFGAGYGVLGVSGTDGYGIVGTTGAFTTTGTAARFDIANASNTNDAVLINNMGLGGSLNISSSNASNAVTMVRVTKTGTGDFIVFENGTGINRIRFDNTGKGFFNGGTQASGADMAEAFDVADDIRNYEPGDVLMISVDKDRTVVKAAGAYSSLVAGVYATKPGVLMTEENIDADLSDKVPMGVVGVIPTKVCLEGGEIKRGDFLVTSSIAGVAMKGDAGKIRPGQIIGRALENFNELSVSKIKVLVNVK